MLKVGIRRIWRSVLEEGIHDIVLKIITLVPWVSVEECDKD